MDNRKSAALRQGVFVFITLAVLTAAEYWIGVSTDMAALIFVLFLIKATLVINFYMHVSRLFSPEEGGH